MNKSPRSLSMFVFLPAICLFALCGSASAQSPSAEAVSVTYPDSPGAILTLAREESSSLQNGSTRQPQANLPPAGTRTAPPKRLFGIVPNFRSVSTDETLPRQTTKDKFVDATKDSFDYSSLALASLVALEGYVSTADPEFGRGGLGYSRYLWHSAADQTIENYLVEFIIPVIAHEDTRFYTLTRGSVARRTGYSLGQVFVTKSDNGKRTFNAGEIFGAAISSGISNFYYPRPERTFHNFGTKYATNIGIDAASYFVKEFYPEISHVFTRGKYGPQAH